MSKLERKIIARIYLDLLPYNKNIELIIGTEQRIQTSSLTTST